MNAHALDIVAQMRGAPEWTKRDGQTRCSYCGSMTVEEVLQAFKTKGTSYSGSDWKYGWPHKFYVGKGKFYSEHLRDATPEQLAEWNAIVQPKVGIGFVRESDAPEDLFFSAPSPGYQTFGDV